MTNKVLNNKELSILRECIGKQLLEIKRSDLPRMMVWEKIQLVFESHNILIFTSRLDDKKGNELFFEDDAFLTVKYCEKDEFNLEGTDFNESIKKVENNIAHVYIANMLGESRVDHILEPKYVYTYGIIAEVGNKFYALLNETLSEMMQIEIYDTEEEFYASMKKKEGILNEEKINDGIICKLEIIRL